jgi:thiamine-monophosphate kinase
LRSRARTGDRIYVSGDLGGSAAAVLHLRAKPKKKLNPRDYARHFYPEPRIQLGRILREKGLANAMIDISDGLSTDLTHIVEESKVSARIYKDRLPAAPGVQEHDLLHGGEEYELIIIANDLPPAVESIPVSLIGEIIDSELENQVFLIDGTQESVLRPRGWQHFASRDNSGTDV